MIPKIIHYCWFGHGKKNKLAIKCIKSWQRFCPDFEIKEWNESNFNVDAIPYTREAYRLHKYAFVSDYARLWILYNYGGVYFDTDVEMIKPLDDTIMRNPFMATETHVGKIKTVSVNPGLGIGSISNNQIINEILALYEQEGLPLDAYIVPFTTKIMLAHGFHGTGLRENVDGITVYSDEYFNPYNYLNGCLNTTSNTYTIHWYGMSWLPLTQRIKSRIGQLIRHFA